MLLGKRLSGQTKSEPRLDRQLVGVLSAPLRVRTLPALKVTLDPPNQQTTRQHHKGTQNSTGKQWQGASCSKSTRRCSPKARAAFIEAQKGDVHAVARSKLQPSRSPQARQLKAGFQSDLAAVTQVKLQVLPRFAEGRGRRPTGHGTMWLDVASGWL